MGVVLNFEEIPNKTVLIVGVGGVGSVVSEMLTKVVWESSFFKTMTKWSWPTWTNFSSLQTRRACPKWKPPKKPLAPIIQKSLLRHSARISRNGNFKVLLTNIQTGAEWAKSGLGFILRQLRRKNDDKYGLNELDQVWFDSGVSEGALSARI